MLGRVASKCEGQPQKTLTVNVAGVTFDGRQAIVTRVTLGEMVRLQREP